MAGVHGLRMSKSHGLSTTKVHGLSILGTVEVFHETWDSCSSTTVFAGEPGTAGNRPDEANWAMFSGNDPDKGITTNGSTLVFANTAGTMYYLRNNSVGGSSVYVDYTFKITLASDTSGSDLTTIQVKSADSTTLSIEAKMYSASASWNYTEDASPDYALGVEFVLQIRLNYTTNKATFYIDGVLQGGPYDWPDAVGTQEQIYIKIMNTGDNVNDNPTFDDIVVGSGLF